MLYENGGDPGFMFVAQFASLLGSVMAFWYMKYKIEELSVSEFLKFNVSQFAFGGMMGALIITACIAMLAVMQFIEVVYVGFDSIPFSIAFFVLVAISEEVVFRGYVLSTLIEKTKPLNAILVSSLIFSSIHLFNNHFGPIGFINIFLSGVLLSFVYLKYNNLSAPVGMHFTWNFFQCLFGFAVSGQQVGGLFIIHHPHKNELITGGAFGLEGSVLLIPVLAIGVWYLGKSTNSKMFAR